LLEPRYRPRAPVTRALIGVMVAVYVVNVALGGDPMWGTGPLGEAGGQYAPAVWAGEWWRLFTAIFLHGGLLHLFVNGFSLYSLGVLVEPNLGPGRYLVLFFGSGLAAALATQAFVTDVPSVGASGAVFGVAGLVLADELARRRQYREIARAGGPRLRPAWSIIPALALNLGLGAAVPVINNYAHVGGLVAGYLLGVAWINATLRHRSRAGLALAALAVLTATLAWEGFQPAFTGEAAYREGFEAARAGDWERAHERLSRAIEQSGGRRADYLAERALVLAEQRRIDESVADANRALAIDPRNGLALHVRGRVFQAIGLSAAGLADLRAACEAGFAQACRAVARP